MFENERFGKKVEKSLNFGGGIKKNRNNSCLSTTASLACSLNLFFVHFLVVFGGGVLVLLVIRHEVVHVGLRFNEFHYVHTLTGVPMEEGFCTEHSSELLVDSLEHLWIAVEFTRKGTTIFSLLRGILQTVDLMLFVIHSMK